MLIHTELGDRRGNWFTSLQEYDLEIKTTKLVKGKRLCKLDVEALHPRDDDEVWDSEVEILEKEVLYMLAYTNSWYNDLKHYLTHSSSPRQMDARKI